MSHFGQNGLSVGVTLGTSSERVNQVSHLCRSDCPNILSAVMVSLALPCADDVRGSSHINTSQELDTYMYPN